LPGSSLAVIALAAAHAAILLYREIQHSAEAFVNERHDVRGQIADPCAEPRLCDSTNVLAQNSTVFYRAGDALRDKRA
jgi:hypothetical protein